MSSAHAAGTTVSYDANVRPALGSAETLRSNFRIGTLASPTSCS